MNKNFITVTDIDDRLQTININHISRVVWAEDRDEDGIVDMVYLSEGAECAEIALAPQSESSKYVMAGITAGTTYHEKVFRYLNPKNKD
jgi:hypothetical protein